MASFDENGKYIKTNWKAGDKITATKLNKIEESIEAVNDNDISRHVEADARLDALEAKDIAHDKEFTNVKNTIADNKAAAELGDYEINSRMTFLERELNEGIAEVNDVASTVDGKIATAEANMTAQVNTAKDEMTAQVNTAKDEMTAQVNTAKADMEAMVAEVAEVEGEMNELKNDMTYAKMQSATVTDAYKFTVDDDEMVPSLVTLNNIEGLSSVETNDRSQKYLVSTNISTICTIDINGKNYAEDIVCIETPFGSECIIDGTDITVRRNEPYTDNITAFAFGSMSIPTLEDGKKYCVFCDDVEISNGGASAIEIHSGNDPFMFGDNWNSVYLNTRTSNYIFIYDTKSFVMRLHCTVGSHVGEVTYKNLQIYEVKEMIVPDIQLNSLPNGVKDEIKDGILIKRTGIVNLAELTWKDNYASDTMITFYSIVDDITLASDYYVNDNNIVSNMFQCTSTNVVDDFSIAGDFAISAYHDRPEIKIRLPKSSGVSDTNSLMTWLRNNNVYAVYELATPEYIPVNLNIKVDKGDTVVINTTKTMDLTYDIQLNTRSQIDAIQETVARTDMASAILRDNINTLQNDLEYELKYDQFDNGYYILPGGLIIQFGYVTFPANHSSSETIDYILTLPLKIPNRVITVITSMSGGDNGWDSRVSGHALNNSQVRIVMRGLNYAITNTMYWLVIGR